MNTERRLNPQGKKTTAQAILKTQRNMNETLERVVEEIGKFKEDTNNMLPAKIEKRFGKKRKNVVPTKVAHRSR